jgi:hypothetical protein
VDLFRFAIGLDGAIEVALDLGLFRQSLGQLGFDRGALALRKRPELTKRAFL